MSITYLSLRLRYNYGLGKRTAALLEFSFWFRSWRMCSHQRVILYLYSKFPRNRMIGGGVITSYRIFKMAVIKLEIYSRLCRFSDSICLRRWKSICKDCILNFNKISQSTADIKLLLVSENGRPPYWNSVCCFDFDESIVIEMTFCISLPNFVLIGRSSSELWHHIEYSRWRP